MAKNVRTIAERLGADLVGEIPDVGGGAFGAERLARLFASLRNPTTPRQGLPTEVILDEATLRKLARLAERASTPQQPISPTQLAARLLEEAVAALPDE